MHLINEKLDIIFNFLLIKAISQNNFTDYNNYLLIIASKYIILIDVTAKYSWNLSTNLELSFAKIEKIAVFWPKILSRKARMYIA